jgi:hypothetical protein
LGRASRSQDSRLPHATRIRQALGPESAKASRRCWVVYAGRARSGNRIQGAAPTDKTVGISSCSSGFVSCSYSSSSSSSIPRICSHRFRTTDGPQLREHSSICDIGPANRAIRGRGRERQTRTSGRSSVREKRGSAPLGIASKTIPSTEGKVL